MTPTLRERHAIALMAVRAAGGASPLKLGDWPALREFIPVASGPRFLQTRDPPSRRGAWPAGTAVEVLHDFGVVLLDRTRYPWTAPHHSVYLHRLRAWYARDRVRLASHSTRWSRKGWWRCPAVLEEGVWYDWADVDTGNIGQCKMGPHGWEQSAPPDAVVLEYVTDSTVKAVDWYASSLGVAR